MTENHTKTPTIPENTQNLNDIGNTNEEEKEEDGKPPKSMMLLQMW